MFGEFLKRLTADNPEQLPDPDARLALTALLVRLAKSDGHYADVEAARIGAILQRRFDLSTSAALELRESAEQLESEAPDTVRFTRAIKDAVALEDRTQVIEVLWELALVDGDRNDEEDGMLRLVAPLLGINDRDSALARQRVLDRES